MNKVWAIHNGTDDHVLGKFESRQKLGRDQEESVPPPPPPHQHRQPYVPVTYIVNILRAGALACDSCNLFKHPPFVGWIHVLVNLIHKTERALGQAVQRRQEHHGRYRAFLCKHVDQQRVFDSSSLATSPLRLLHTPPD
jgi:hypothetical protein